MMKRVVAFSVGVLSALSTLASAQGTGDLVSAAKQGDVPAIRAALAAGAGVHDKGDAGMTPLMWAALHGHMAAIDELLTAGARVNDADSDGATALAYARAAGHLDARKQLESKGGQLGTVGSDPMKLFIWLASRRPDIFNYIAARGKEAKAKAQEEERKAAAVRDANWTAALQAPADFRGTWRIDHGASKYGKFPKPKTVTYTITQTTQSLDTDVDVDGKRMKSQIALDGTESENAMGADGRTLSKAQWEGSSLKISSALLWQNVEKAVQEERWSLSADRKVLTIERKVTKPMEAQLRLVLKKQ